MTIDSSKILVAVPTPSISHQVVFRPLVQALLDRGHEVVYITADPMYVRGENPKNLQEIDVHDLSYTVWKKAFKTMVTNKLNDVVSIMDLVFQVLAEVFAEQLKHEAIQHLIKDSSAKFDLLILEDCVTPTLILSHIFKAPVIKMSSFGANPGNMDLMGAVTHLFLYPTHYHERIYNLTILEKISELCNHINIDWVLYNREKVDQRMLSTLLNDNIPSFKELKNNVDMLFLNVHPICLDNQPVPRSVLYIWGIHKTPAKTLSKDLKSYLNKSESGVIYFSLGTNFNTSAFPPKMLEIFINVFSRLPYNVLWKWDTDELSGRSHNIKISKWFPQTDLLKHPNVKLFITQGGLQSTDEAINAGIPLIGIPMFADHKYNTEKYVRFNIGIQLEFKSLTEDTFESAIRSVIENNSYKENIIRLKTLMNDQPQPPLEQAVWWVEHVLRHGGARHLRSPAANMSWPEYYELPLVLVLLTCLLAVISVFITLLYSCLTFVSCKLKSLKVKIS